MADALPCHTLHEEEDADPEPEEGPEEEDANPEPEEGPEVELALPSLFQLCQPPPYFLL